MKDHAHETAETMVPISRRSFLSSGAALSIGAGALALASVQPAMAQDAKTESLLDTWTRTKKARLGIDLSNPPLRFKNADGKPAGLMIEYLEILLKDIGTEPEYIEMPFGQTFAALAAGKFDMIATFVTALPSRALRGAFAGFPAYYQQNVAYLKPGSKLTKLSDLNKSGVTIACQQGTSEETTLKAMFPKAGVSAFPQLADASAAVGTGRVDALITDTVFSKNVFKTFPDVTIISEPVNAIANTFFMPHNDFKLWAYLTNWLRYQGSLRTIVGLQNKWMGTEAWDKYKIPSLGVGSGGEPIIITQ
jgi:polar amino acid transport system substrate-binding protein